MKRAEPKVAYVSSPLAGRLAEAESIINGIYAKHLRLFVHGEERPGFGGLEQRRFFCEECRTEWPCKTVIALDRYGQVEPADTADYKPLRVQVKPADQAVERGRNTETQPEETDRG